MMHNIISKLKRLVPTRDVDLLAPDDDNLLAVEDELGDNGGQTAHHVASAVNHYGLGGEARHSSERHQNYYDILLKAVKIFSYKRFLCVDLLF